MRWRFSRVSRALEVIQWNEGVVRCRWRYPLARPQTSRLSRGLEERPARGFRGLVVRGYVLLRVGAYLLDQRFPKISLDLLLPAL